MGPAFLRGCELVECARYAEALEEFEQSEDTWETRWNRAQTLLALGRYQEGFAENAIRLRMFPRLLISTGHAIRDVVPTWRGESLSGKHIVLIHEQGLGDAVLMLRYVDILKKMGCFVSLEMPKELRRFCSSIAPPFSGGANYCCPMFDLPLWLGTTPQSVPCSNLRADPALIEEWSKFFTGSKELVGIAWVAKNHDPERTIAIDKFLACTGLGDGVDLVSLQTNEREKALARRVIVPKIRDVADVAAIACLMSRIVSIDTLALNVVGAVNHPNVIGLIPYHTNWKWLCGNPWYPNIRLLRQSRPGDWSDLCEF